MEQTPNADGRMSHLEEQISGLADDVSGLKELLHDFLGEMADLQTELIKARRYAAKTSLMADVNTARRWLRETARQDDSKVKQALECIHFIDRRHAAVRAELDHAEEPEKLASTTVDAIKEFLTQRSFHPWVDT